MSAIASFVKNKIDIKSSFESEIASATAQVGSTTIGDIGDNEDQLAQDLAQFLANPSLSAALADGSLDLKSYAETVQAELDEMEKECIAVYRSKESEIQSLRADLATCHNVLSQLHEMLSGFQTDLGGLSGDIRNLQQKSRTLDIQLRNRRSTEHKLRHYLQHIVIAPTVAETIMQHPVNSSNYLAAVQEIQQLYTNCSLTVGTSWSCDVPINETLSAGQEMLKELVALRNVAVKRIREYLLQQLYQLRQPQTNVRFIQVHGLLKYAALYDFLEEYQADASQQASERSSVNIAVEIFNVYVEIMSSTVKQLFRTYSQQLLLLDSTRYSCTRSDVIAMDDAVLRESVAQMSAVARSHPHRKRIDPFCLNSRNTDVLGSTTTELGLPPRIAVHVSILQKEQYSYERLYGSILGHLLDAVTNEHVFCRQFFKRDAFTPLFSGTLSILLEHIENYLFTCYDALCLLLMIQVTHAVRSLARERKIYALDSFLDQIIHLLWPRLKTVIDGHYRSIQQATAVSLAVTDTHAHYVSRRFGELCCSILLIMHHSNDCSRRKPQSPIRMAPESLKVDVPPGTSESGKKGSSAVSRLHDDAQQSAGAKLLEDLSDMIDAYLALLERVSEIHSSQKKRVIFLINNLDHVVCIFQERRVVGKECNKLLERLLKYREDFVEEELLTGFSKMIAFIQQTETYMASVLASQTSNDGIITYDVNPSVVEALVLDFASNWKSNIDQINRNVLSYFSNFRNGMEILKHCLTQLLLYYTRFQDIIRKVWKKSLPSFTKDLVSTNVILAEIKRYALAI
jgi:vacuolar protein sorting-associated protein 52